jgi:hypothetical protein
MSIVRKQGFVLVFSVLAANVYAQSQNVSLPSKTIPVGVTENYQALETIVLDADSTFIVEGSCALKAGIEILLEGEFEAKPNASFCAILGGVVAFAHPSPSLDASYFWCKGGYFNLRFEERYHVTSGDIDITFKDASNQIIYQPSGYPVVTGINTYEFNLGATGLFTQGAYYTVEIVDSKKQRSYVRIRF